MRDEAIQFGRDPDALELSLGHLVAKIDLGRAEKFAAMGADRVVLAMPPTADLNEARDVLSRLRAKTVADAMSLNSFDRLALTDLVHLYASAVDDRRFDDVVELFTETAELRLPDPPRSLEPVRRHHGRDGVRAAMAALAAVTRTEHAIVGEVYAARRRCRLRVGPHHVHRSPLDGRRRDKPAIWCGICATTTSTCARGRAGGSTAAR